MATTTSRARVSRGAHQGPARLAAVAAVALAVAGPARLAWAKEPDLAALAAAVERAVGPERTAAVHALGRVRTRACVELLDRIRRNDPDPQVRQAAITTLGTVGVEPAPTILQDLLAQGTPQDRASAISALAQVRPPVPPAAFLARLGPNEDAAVRQGALRALGGYHDVEVARALAQALAAARAAPGDDAAVRAAREALGRTCAKAPANAWLASEGLAARAPWQAALPDLVRLAPEGAEGLPDAVRALATHAQPAVREAVADALGLLDAGKGLSGQADASLAVLARLLGDPGPDVVLAAGVALGRVGPAGDALAALLDLARGRNPGLKALAIGALGGVVDPRAVKACAQAVDDDALPVRAAAVDALSRTGTRECVAALVKALKANRNTGRLEADTLAALVQLTGARPGDDHAAWSRWWKLVEADWTPPAGDAQAARPRTGEAAGGSKTRKVPTYYGSEVVSRRVCFVVDVSGSMSAPAGRRPTAEGTSAPGATPPPTSTRIDVLREQLESVLAALPDGALVNVISFHGSAVPWKESVVRMGRAERRSVLDFAAALKASGGTNIYDPLERALLDPDVDTIYLMTDGSPGSGKWVAQEDILREVAKLNAVRRVAIHAVAVGAESELCKQLAAQNGGTYTSVR